MDRTALTKTRQILLRFNKSLFTAESQLSKRIILNGCTVKQYL
jgi:hypothetical protein